MISAEELKKFGRKVNKENASTIDQWMSYVYDRPDFYAWLTEQLMTAIQKEGNKSSCRIDLSVYANHSTLGDEYTKFCMDNPKYAHGVRDYLPASVIQELESLGYKVTRLENNSSTYYYQYIISWK